MPDVRCVRHGGRVVGQRQRRKTHLMGGGGHFDSAGAQMSNVSIQDALATLRACIDEYMDENM